MNLRFNIFTLLFFISTGIFAQRKELLQRMEDYLEIRNTVTDDKETEIARIKDFLIEDRSPDSLATLRYILWTQELEEFGKEKDRIQRIDFLKSQKVAVVKTQKLRNHPIKRKNGKTRAQQVSMRFIYTWEQRDGKWYIRNINQFANPKF